MTSVLEDAEAAFRRKELVEVVRSGLDGSRPPWRGFVVGMSSEIVLLHRLSDRLDLDGYAAVRTRDITECRAEFTKKDFYLKALTLKDIRPEKPEDIDLSSVQALMRSVDERYPLVTITREQVFPNECEIGRLKLSSGETYALRFISPTATWEDDFRTYRYSDVTLIQFDGEYERTLALVAGDAA